MSWRWFHQWGSPRWFYERAGRWQLVCGLLALILLVVGSLWGLGFAPVDYQQGNSYRIIYLHVPVAFLAQAMYAAMAVCAVVLFVWKMKLADVAMQAIAVTGLAFTVLSLVSGAVWGKPTWGTYWVWDARLTSELVLLFLYLGVIALYNAYDEPRKAARAAALLALVGVVNLPIIHFSVQWWNTLHQGSSITASGSSIHPSMLWPLLIMAIAAKFYYGANLLARARVTLMRQDHKKQWVQEALQAGEN